MPKLQRLEINSCESYFDERVSLLSKPLFIVPKLRTIKISWSSRNSDQIFFNSLHQILPNLKCLFLNLIHDYFTKDFLNTLIYYWWPVIGQLERINIFIKFRRTHMTVDNNMRINFNQSYSPLT
ncbi:unnamed protein product [Rotaria sp. Silwood2]|nr:unnamed protein product [Rotaria sp. Silwood2]CAF4129038.1 unnamed protein product [Rotaria sp. Silwood2]